MRHMTTPLACPALAALWLANFHTGRRQVAAVMVGSREAQLRPVVGAEPRLVDVINAVGRWIQQDADLARAETACQGDDGA